MHDLSGNFSILYVHMYYVYVCVCVCIHTCSLDSFCYDSGQLLRSSVATAIIDSGQCSGREFASGISLCVVHIVTAVIRVGSDGEWVSLWVIWGFGKQLEREREHAQENIKMNEYWIKHYCKLSTSHLTDVCCIKLVQSPQGKILTTYIVNDSILLVHTLTHSSLVKDYKLWLIISMKQRCHIYICICCMSSSTHLENLYLYY